jgi:hypothetical protein
MDAKAAQTLSLLALKANTEKTLAPVFKEIEDAASEGLFCVDFVYGENVETYCLVKSNKSFLERMGYKVAIGCGWEGTEYQVRW